MGQLSTDSLLTDTLLYFVPAVLVLMGMFMVIRRFTDNQLVVLRKMIERDLQLKVMEERSTKRSSSLPLKLQAYERLILFLERISPNSLLVRVQQGASTSQSLHLELLVTIRTEFEHNLSQQLYVSDEAWTKVCEAKDEIVEMVNDAYRSVGPNASGVQLSARIFENVMGLDVLPTHKTISILKKEATSIIQ
ncbi:MAG: hypothetical protein ACKOQ6_06370 [Bacteroidota bacterium]